MASGKRGAAKKADAGLDFAKAAEVLRENWSVVCDAATLNPQLSYVSEPALIEAIGLALNDKQVSYRFCLPIQVLGKVTDSRLDSLRLQKRRGDPTDVTGWDARSLGSKVVAPFNREQEYILGSSADPYVGNPMRIPRMFKDDASKKDIVGWNRLVEVLERVEGTANPDFTLAVFRQVLLEMLRRQQSLRFSYPAPPRISLEQALDLAARFLEDEKSGGDRALALAGALFDAIGAYFKLYDRVNRARINASDEATGLAADLECVNEKGEVILAVEVKDRQLTLSDVEDTLRKTRQRTVRDVLFAVSGIMTADSEKIGDRVSRAFASGQNIYVFELLDLARSVLALGGESIRGYFITKVGEHLDTWNTQPRHRKAWKDLLSKV